MYKILIVDDEKIERNGIKLLINKYNLGLSVEEAANGEEALQYISKNRVDILFTDIKMPFMDGLELARRSKLIDSSLKIIIFSAYDEFEYAKEAITLDVQYYILKPIKIAEFLETMSKVIKKCKEEEKQKEREEMLLTVYQKEKIREKEIMLLDILLSDMGYKRFKDKTQSAIYDISLNVEFINIRLILLNFKNRFFDSYKSDFKNHLNSIIDQEFYIVNINEYQSVIFIEERHSNKTYIENIGNQLADTSNSHYNNDVCIIISRIINSIEEVHREYAEAEKLVEYKFLYKGSIVFFVGESLYKENSTFQPLDEVICNINKYIELNDYLGFKESFDIFISHIQNTEHFTSSYIKHICIEILGKAFENTMKNDKSYFYVVIDEIDKTQDIYHLRDVLLSTLQKLKYDSHGIPIKYKGAIAEVLNIIHREYATDISLEYLAEKVFLSPSYLSYLFRSITGVNIVKYITNYRLGEAKKLLSSTNMKIVDVSKSVGYFNQSYFCSIFKNYCGISPGQYREGIDEVE
jgi:two-component system response regulator YesN